LTLGKLASTFSSPKSAFEAIYPCSHANVKESLKIFIGKGVEIGGHFLTCTLAADAQACLDDDRPARLRVVDLFLNFHPKSFKIALASSRSPLASPLWFFYKFPCSIRRSYSQNSAAFLIHERCLRVESPREAIFLG